MPTPNGTSIYLPASLGDTIRGIASGEARNIVTVVGRMAALYEPLTASDHAIIAQVARDLDLRPGQALSHIVHDWHERQPTGEN